MQNIADHGTNGSIIFFGSPEWKMEDRKKDKGGLEEKEERGKERKRGEKEGEM